MYTLTDMILVIIMSCLIGFGIREIVSILGECKK